MNTEPFISYAQNGEDVMLFRALKHVDNGFYIDVGAQDPVIDSVTKAFYERGWRGINVEPVQHWYQRLLEERPRDVNLLVAVSDHEGDLTLYESSDSGLSTSEERFARDARQRGWKLRENVVPCATLSKICMQHVDGPVHFLKIDCEGGEAAALRGMPLDRVRPWIVVVEASEPNSTVRTYRKWQSLLTRNDYGFVYSDGISRYYVANEHAELRRAFRSPPNVLDGYIRADEARAHRRVQELHQDALSLKSDADRQNTELAIARRECDAIGTELARLRLEYRGITEEKEATHTELSRLQQQYRDVAKAKEATRTELSRLQQQYRDVTEEKGAMLTELARVQQTYRDVSEEKEATRTELSRLQQQYRDVAKAKEATRTELSRLQQQYRDITEERETIRAELLRLQRQCHELAGEREALLDELAAMRSSRSWRLTAPLRALRRTVGKGKRVASQGAIKNLRPLARTLRPMLRRLAQNRTTRRLVVGAMGQNTSIVRHGRLFLFGPPPSAPASPDSNVGLPAEPDALNLSRLERIALSELQRALTLRSDGRRDA